jgi:hypothetical protein
MSDDMQMNSERNIPFTNSSFHSFIYVWIAAIIGVLFLAPTIPNHLPANVHSPFSINTLILINIIVLAIFTAIFAAVGAYLTPRIGFRANLVDIPIKKKVFWNVLQRQFFYGVSIGFAGAIIAYFITSDFIAYLNSYTFLSRLFGGLYEEVIMRWGLMTIIVWISWRIFQHGIGIPKRFLVYSCIFLSQILFAFGHFPALKNFGIINPIGSIVTIFIVSLPWGWLFWKQGLESAFIAHSSFHAFVALFVAIKL